MRKVVFCVSAIFLCYTAQADISVRKKNGGKKGYRNVEESHSNGNSSLDCWSPGNESCGFTVPPNTGDATGIYTTTLGYVESEIINSNNSGTAIIQGKVVEWEGQNLENYSFHIYD